MSLLGGRRPDGRGTGEEVGAGRRPQALAGFLLRSAGAGRKSKERSGLLFFSQSPAKYTLPFYIFVYVIEYTFLYSFTCANQFSSSTKRIGVLFIFFPHFVKDELDKGCFRERLEVVSLDIFNGPPKFTREANRGQITCVVLACLGCTYGMCLFNLVVFLG